MRAERQLFTRIIDRLLTSLSLLEAVTAQLQYNAHDNHQRSTTAAQTVSRSSVFELVNDNTPQSHFSHQHHSRSVEESPHYIFAVEQPVEQLYDQPPYHQVGHSHQSRFPSAQTVSQSYFCFSLLKNSSSSPSGCRSHLQQPMSNFSALHLVHSRMSLGLGPGLR